MEASSAMDFATILRNQVDPAQFRMIIEALSIPDVDYEAAFPDEDHIHNLLRWVEERNQQQELKDLLLSLVDLSSELTKPHLDSVYDPETDAAIEGSFLYFSNREEEIDRVLICPGPFNSTRRFLLEGPSGYGKSRLLRHLEEALRFESILTLRIIADSDDSVEALLHKATALLGVDRTHVDHNRSPIDHFVSSLIDKCHDTEYNKAALLIDFNGLPSENSATTASILITTTVKQIYRQLKPKGLFIEDKAFRIIIAGRGLRERLSILIPEQLEYITILSLKPLNFEHIRDLCEDLWPSSNDQDRRAIDLFAAELLHHTTGHPRCIAKTLKLFGMNNLHSTFFTIYEEQIMQQIVLPLANHIRDGINPPIWRKVFDTLCFYRRLDSDLLGSLMKNDILPRTGAFTTSNEERQGYELFARLLRGTLLVRDEKRRRHLVDEVTRRLLVSRRRSELSCADFAQECQRAIAYYSTRLDEAGESRPFWAREILFQHLQAGSCASSDRDTRRNLYNTLMQIHVPSILERMNAGRDPRIETDDLISLLREDMELQFSWNYFLRDGDRYDRRLFEKLIEKIEALALF